MPWASVTELRALAWGRVAEEEERITFRFPISLSADHLAASGVTLREDATVLPAAGPWKRPRRREDVRVIPQVRPPGGRGGHALLQDLGALSTATKASSKR